jgi:hypothetical protein
MSLLPDHMLCPALAPWLPRLLEGARAARFVPAGWTPPRGLRKLIADLPEVGEGECDVAVVLAPLHPTIPDAIVRALDPGARVIEIGVPVVGSPLTRLTPWRRRRVAEAQAADRIARWIEAGLTEAEQWVTIDPPDIVVTLGRMS